MRHTAEAYVVKHEGASGAVSLAQQASLLGVRANTQRPTTSPDFAVFRQSHWPSEQSDQRHYNSDNHYLIDYEGQGNDNRRIMKGCISP